MNTVNFSQPFPDYVTCPQCGEPEVEVWCCAVQATCHNCHHIFDHSLPPECQPARNVNVRAQTARTTPHPPVEKVAWMMTSRFKPPLPKEHGAWAMLTVPLLISWAIAPNWRWQSTLAVVAVVGLFLARYPLETMLKTKKRISRLPAWSIIYAGLAIFAGGWLIVVDRLFWLIPIGLLGAMLMLLHFRLAAQRQEMSALGELSGIFGLALGAPIIYYAASNQLDGTALALWLINSLYFGGTVFYIKLKVRQQPRLPAPDRLSERLIKAKACLTYQGATLTIVLLMAALHSAPMLIPLAFVPMTIKVLHGAYRWQDKRSLSLPRLGLIELFHSALFAVLVVAASK